MSIDTSKFESHTLTQTFWTYIDIAVHLAWNSVLDYLINSYWAIKNRVFI